MFTVRLCSPSVTCLLISLIESSGRTDHTSGRPLTPGGPTLKPPGCYTAIVLSITTRPGPLPTGGQGRGALEGIKEGSSQKLKSLVGRVH